ncbi:helix-turn-helix domain-containing protein [Acetobacter orientalis]|uniref:helix-turn-helix domain-containing protein n=1 Tax=Acetobacter orientalis TaxID=146474 RepID=UPI0039EBA062
MTNTKFPNTDPSHTVVPRATSVDAHVGKRIKLRRIALGFSQEKLGELVGITFQQIQKYERGANRVGASRLYDIAGALDVPLDFFFDGVDRHPQPGTLQKEGFAQIRKAFEGAPSGSSDPMDAKTITQPETLELVQAYYAIPDANVRRNVLELIRSMNPQKPETSN